MPHEYMTLLGADDVRNASSRMQSAAEDMRNAAGNFDSSVHDMRIILDDFNIRFAQNIERLEEILQKSNLSIHEKS